MKYFCEFLMIRQVGVGNQAASPDNSWRFGNGCEIHA